MLCPHCGQKLARPRTAAPQFPHRRAISGSDIKTNDEGGMMNDELRKELSLIHHSSFRLHRFLRLCALR
jgi:hypothetical protein